MEEIRNGISGKKNVTVIYPSYLDHVDHDAFAKEKDVATPLCGFHGTLLTFLHKYRSVFDYTNHFQLIKKKVEKSTFEDLVLKNIYFWSVKHITDDTNAQSLVFSCTLPDIKTSFVFTGDATPATFESIPVKAKNQLRTTFKTSIAVNDHKVCFVVPHHGAVGHYSEKACDLFKPDVLVFSAGYIGNFNHPAKETGQLYIDFLNKLWDKDDIPFNTKYALATEEYKTALYDEKKKKYTLKKPVIGKVVLLGTNFLALFS